LAAGQVLIAFAELLSPPFWIPWFLGCQIVAGSGGSIFMVNHVAYLSGSTDRKGRSYAFSLREATAPFAGFIGSLLGGVLPSVFSSLTAVGMDNPGPYRWTILVAAAISGTSLFAVLRADPVEKPEQARGQKEARGSRVPTLHILLYAVFAFFLITGAWSVITFFNVYLDDGLRVSTALIGAVVAVTQLAGGIAALWAPAVITRLGNKRCVLLAIAGMFLGLMPLAFIPAWWAAAAGRLIICVSNALGMTAFTVLYQEGVDSQWRSVAAGAVQVAFTTGRFVLSLGGGRMIVSAGYRAYHLAIACAMIAGGAVALFLHQGPGESSRQPEAEAL
jgi:predicted MFS family arabinose efflux permease